MKTSDAAFTVDIIIQASEWHKGWKTTTNTPHTYVAEESIPLYCLKKPPSPPKRVPFPSTKHPPSPSSPFLIQVPSVK